MPRTLGALVACALAVALAGCDGGSSAAEVTPQTTTEGSMSEPPSDAPSETPPADYVDEYWESTVVAFVDEMHVESPDFDELRNLTAPDSPANKYVSHQEAVSDASVQAGNNEPSALPVMTPNRDAQTVKFAYKGEDPYVWEDFEVDGDGKLVSWTGASGQLEDVLWTKSSTGHALGAKVSLVSAYLANSGALFAVVKVQAGTAPVTANDNPTLIDSKGILRKASSYTSYGVEVPAHAAVYGAYSFEDADFGGKLQVTLYDEDYNDATVTLPVK